MIEFLGWAASLVFVASYFFTRVEAIKSVQMIAALMWTAYGLLIGASPVVVANLLVFVVAAWTLSTDVRRPQAGRARAASFIQSDTSES
jgi:hypothetical protein